MMQSSGVNTLETLVALNSVKFGGLPDGDDLRFDLISLICLTDWTFVLSVGCSGHGSMFVDHHFC